MTSREHRLLRIGGKILVIGIVVIAAFAAIGGIDALLHGPGPDALREEPVDANARVTDVYVDGFGGDPTVAYEFEVDGQAYNGSGTGGQLGNGDVLKLSVGDPVAIQYAARDPSLSCTCNARTADYWRLPRGGGLDPEDLFSFVPIGAIAVWYASRWMRHKRPLSRAAV